MSNSIVVRKGIMPFYARICKLFNALNTKPDEEFDYGGKRFSHLMAESKRESHLIYSLTQLAQSMYIYSLNEVTLSSFSFPSMLFKSRSNYNAAMRIIKTELKLNSYYTELLPVLLTDKRSDGSFVLTILDGVHEVEQSIINMARNNIYSDLIKSLGNKYSQKLYDSNNLDSMISDAYSNLKSCNHELEFLNRLYASEVQLKLYLQENIKKDKPSFKEWFCTTSEARNLKRFEEIKSLIEQYLCSNIMSDANVRMINKYDGTLCGSKIQFSVRINQNICYSYSSCIVNTNKIIFSYEAIQQPKSYIDTIQDVDIHFDIESCKKELQNDITNIETAISCMFMCIELQALNIAQLTDFSKQMSSDDVFAMYDKVQELKKKWSDNNAAK